MALAPAMAMAMAMVNTISRKRGRKKVYYEIC